MHHVTEAKKKVERYIHSVLSGKRKAGRLEIAAVERHLYDLEHAHERGFHFDEKKAAAACALFPVAMVHTKGEWSGAKFELSDNQAFIVWCVFGWRRENKTRRFRHVYITCARKWGKSEFAAAIGLIGLCLDDPIEPGAEVYCAATKEDQAKIVFNVAKQMANISPVLKELVKVNAKSIVTRKTSDSSFFQPLGSDSKTSDGFNVHIAVLDEIHEWQDRHRGLYEKLNTAHGARRQALIVVITTAGDDLSEIWWEMDLLCQSALTNFQSDNPPGDNRFAFIARMDEARPCDCGGRDNSCDLCEDGMIPADDPFDPENWPKANPNYPVTPKHEFLEEQAKDAEDNPAALHMFLRYHCNMKVSAHAKAITPVTWARAFKKHDDWDEADVITGGWDMGGQDDLGALGYCARFETGEFDEEEKPIYRYEIDARGYLNTDNERDLTIHPWSGWLESGLIQVGSNELLMMKEQVRSDNEDRYIRQWAFDPANSRDFAQSLELEGVEAVKFHQGAAHWTEPLTRFLKDLKAGRITHNGNPLLEWAALNMITVSYSRGATILLQPDKATSPEKIDPIIAVIMAYRLCAIAPPRPRGRLFSFGSRS